MFDFSLLFLFISLSLGAIFTILYAFKAFIFSMFSLSLAFFTGLSSMLPY